ncbi:hypothetical protein DBR00_11470 [Pseudomonas sp. HMWF032]|uniref:hypothetical protein n=1 Tax=Pseudomonas sp. HMWF032 TaxID=2056866 RepID=UPI000D36591E|nr:hypothetical protein [Pseudomonas sp. HMWF032]PTS83994.1 hypothetical protein DBR00_11470 [Pseudomonas sp. HMWF032]PTT85349.1 hypothetical protein DBR41_04055 [Pseudomonas sp. HMWF010]
MAQIPLGAPPQVMPQTGQVQVVTTNPESLNRGGQAIAGGLQDVANTALREQARQTQEDQALARVKAGNALIDRESQIKTIAADLGEKMRTGVVPYDKAEEVYNAAVTKLAPIDTPGLDEVTRGEFGNSLKRMQVGGVDRIRAAVSGARIESAKADLVSRMDMLGKDAALPDANIDQINARMDNEDIDAAGRLAFGEAWTSKKQEFRDSNWTTHATQRVIGARDGLQTLKQIENDLTAEDGFYAKKLDPEKRNQLLNTVTGRIFQVQEHQQRQGEMREMKAMRALDQMDKQAASGLPPTPADQQRWQATLSGTSLAPEYNTRIVEMNEVQKLLRQPLAVQSQYLEQKRQQMAQNGGSVADQANVERLQRAVDSNTQLMREQPLLFNAQRTGEDVPPLDLSGIATPEGQQQIADQLATRFDTVNALRNQYGPEVSRNPWRPEEASMLKSFVAQADDGAKLQLLSALARAAPSGSDYSESLKAIAADQPATMLAGLAQFRGLKGADGTDVPKVLLAGSKVLADKSTPMPGESDLRMAFEEQVGNSIAGGTPQREQAYLAFKSLYAGLSGPRGVRHDGPQPMVDDDLVEEAVQMATGGIGERAGAKVVKPYGMDDKAFDSVVDAELEGLAARTGFDLGQLEDMPLSPVPGKEGAYYLMNAGRVQLDPTTQQPMTVIIK